MEDGALWDCRCPSLGSASSAVLKHLSATDPPQVCRAIDRFTAARNEDPAPFEWMKSVVHPGSFKHHYADLS